MIRSEVVAIISRPNDYLHVGGGDSIADLDLSRTSDEASLFLHQDLRRSSIRDVQVNL